MAPQRITSQYYKFIFTREKNMLTKMKEYSVMPILTVSQNIPSFKYLMKIHSHCDVDRNDDDKTVINKKLITKIQEKTMYCKCKKLKQNFLHPFSVKILFHFFTLLRRQR